MSHDGTERAGWLADDPSGDSDEVYESVTCLARRRKQEAEMNWWLIPEVWLLACAAGTCLGVSDWRR
jgi:hypothetical protein